MRPNVQASTKKPIAPKRTKHSAKEITGEFEVEEVEEVSEEPKEEQNTEDAADQGNTVLDEESEDDDEESEDQIQEMTEKLDSLTTENNAQEQSGESSSSTAEVAAETKEVDDTTETAEGTGKAENGEDDDDDGEWITPENLKKFKRHGTLKPKKKVRQSILMQVACTTGDYAMQNVLLQMGLNLLSIDGLRISKVKNWVLRCHACTK